MSYEHCCSRCRVQAGWWCDRWRCWFCSAVLPGRDAYECAECHAHQGGQSGSDCLDHGCRTARAEGRPRPPYSTRV